MDLSIVIPVFNEEESLDAFLAELDNVLKKLGKSYEVIFADDGSTDSSLSILKRLAEKNHLVRVFSFRKNQGKAEALTLGFQKAKGEVIVTLDADLQDQPSEIPNLLKKLNDGFDLVSGWRKYRKDSSQKLLASKLFNFLASIFWGLNLHDYNCGLKAYKAEAAKSLRLYGGFHRFIPLIAHQEGFSVTEIPVVHKKRQFGVSKYKFSKLWKDLPDIFTMLFLARYSKRPLHFFGTVGIIMVLVGVVILAYLSLLHFLGQAIGQRPLLILDILLILSGFQVLFTGFIAELIISVHSRKEMNFQLRFSTDEVL